MVSVIMAVRNGGRFLAQAIESVLAQDYRPMEILIIDGRSEDETVSIAESYSGVRCISNKNQGVSDCRNLGIAISQGKYCTFLSHDDLWTTNKLRVQIGFMENHPDIEYTIARSRFFLEPGHSLAPGMRAEWLQGDHVARIPETLAAKRSVFERVGYFDTTLNTAEDVDWFARASDLSVPMTVIQETLLLKRLHDRNLSQHAQNTSNLLRVLRCSAARKQGRL
jgi:glycosyltransferase involved in cell wall biosynthesis